MARVLVTGSEGTLGKKLCEELTERGHEVYGADLQHTHDPKYVRCDVAEQRQVQRLFDAVGPDFVYHLAAEFGRVNGEHYYEQLWRTNQIGTSNVIKASLEFGAKVILAGSSEAYGDSGEAFLREDYLDTHAPLFHNQYALSKWVQERQVFIAAQNDGLKAVVLRFFNAYGPGEYYSSYRSVVCLFCYRLLHGLPITIYQNGHRDFMYVDDWARTVANIVERFDGLPRGTHPSRVPVYNIGGNEYRSIVDMAKVVMKTIESLGLDAEKPKITYLDTEAHNVVNKRPSLTIVERDLDHKPTVNLEEGILRTIQWMRETYKVPAPALAK
jgi:dTDP-glucose 4,6-dehydratase